MNRPFSDKAPRTLFALLLAGAVPLSTPALAAPWIDPGDLRMRHSLQTLSDHRDLNTPLTTWPVMWDAIGQGLQDGRRNFGPGSQELAYVQFERSRYARPGLRGEIQLEATRNQQLMLRGFADQPREDLSGGATVEWVGNRFAGAISYQYVDDPQDDREHRYDGSYLAANAGNWVLGAGAIDRWWGPGWQSSLILSSNARPIPGVWFNRRTPSAPEWSWFNWIGPWQLTFIAGQKESNRKIPEAKLLGMRLTFMPISGLEIGLVRTAQWGGEGMPETVRAFGKTVIGDTNDERIANQLAGIDWRYGFTWGDTGIGFYGQVIGEDEAGYLPAKRIGQVGFDMSSHWISGSQRWFLEGTNTAVRDFQTNRDARFGVAYNHSAYNTGYYYRGRNIANTFGSDASAYTLGAMQFFDNGHNLAVSVTNAHLNRPDGPDRAARNQDDNVRAQIPTMRQRIWHATLRYERPALGGWLTLQSEFTDQPIVLPGSDIPSSKWQLLGSWRYRF